MCNKWISVEDELPELGVSVLVFNGYSDSIGTATLEEWKTGFGFRWDGFGSVVYNATHWIKIPDAPNEE